MMKKSTCRKSINDFKNFAMVTYSGSEAETVVTYCALGKQGEASSARKTAPPKTERLLCKQVA